MDRETCPNCGKTVLFEMGSLPTHHGAMVFEVPCPHCDTRFPVGYVDKPELVWSEAQRRSDELAERQAEEARRKDELAKQKAEKAAERSTAETSRSAGGGHGGAPRSDSNDQRSNALNPNNSASRAAANNRSNQMNPNSSALGSSRGGGRRR